MLLACVQQAVGALHPVEPENQLEMCGSFPHHPCSLPQWPTVSPRLMHPLLGVVYADKQQWPRLQDKSDMPCVLK